MGQAKSLVLAGPFSGEIANGRDSNAAREPSINCGLDERGRDKGKSYRSVDLPDTAFLAFCDLLNAEYRESCAALSGSELEESWMAR